MKVSSELRLMKIKIFRMKKEMGDNPAPMMVPPQNMPLRNAEKVDSGGLNGS
jgi:hypothetical protein